ncbi:MAG: class I SAM-dependent methyltransferase [Polyangiales bacterium]
MANVSFKYLRHRLFYSTLAPASRYARDRRMKQLLARMKVAPGHRIIDLGGMPETWAGIDIPLELTLLNRPGTSFGDLPSQHKIDVIEGDACDVPQFGADSFDMAFSNSVIEHVGDDSQQDRFAAEARRLGRSYWVQTPAIWFPIEPHTGMPFWFLYPERLRQHVIEGWRKKLPAWTEMVEETRVLSRGRMEALFPDGQIFVERLGGIPKSYCAYRVR